MRLAVMMIAICLTGPALAQRLDPSRDQLDSRDRLLGWEAVGRLDLGSGYCTGTLIATDLVLTAAHCLFDRDTGTARDPARMTFRAGLRGSEAVAEARALRAVAHPRYDPTAGVTPENVRHDVALVQLRQPIAAAIAAPFPVNPLPTGQTVSVVSYARGRDDALSWQRECRLLGRQDGLVAMNCDVDFGSSGAPVFDLSRGRGRIVALVSAGARDTSRSIGFAMELPRLVAALEMALRTGNGVTRASDMGLPGARRVTAQEGTRTSGARFMRAKPLE
jgi:protease YdgD